MIFCLLAHALALLLELIWQGPRPECDKDIEILAVFVVGAAEAEKGRVLLA